MGHLWNRRWPISGALCSWHWRWSHPANFNWLQIRVGHVLETKNYFLNEVYRCVFIENWCHQTDLSSSCVKVSHFWCILGHRDEAIALCNIEMQLSCSASADHLWGELHALLSSFEVDSSSICRERSHFWSQGCPYFWFLVYVVIVCRTW